MNYDALLPKREIDRRFVSVSLACLARWLSSGEFPPPAETINGMRYWRESDLVAWRDGKRSGWPVDRTVGERRYRTQKALEARGLVVACA